MEIKRPRSFLGGRELQVLVFDQKYIQFKSKRIDVMLYFSPELMRKSQKPNQIKVPWYILASPSDKSEFGAPDKSEFGAHNCPLRALQYYKRFQSEHPELRKGRRRLFLSIKDKEQ